MGLLSNRVNRDSLKPGDHIYSWRAAYIYAHHGVYVGDNKVVHFTRRGQEVGTGTLLDLVLVSSGPKGGHVPCPSCVLAVEGHGVTSSCLDCFLAGGVLYRFEYAVNPALFLAKARGGTCTLAVSDPNDIVVHRAKYLLNNGFGCYNVFKNNCEDFAIYCKTGLLVVDQSTMGQSGQAVSIIGGPLAAVLSTPLRLVTTNIYGMALQRGWLLVCCRLLNQVWLWWLRPLLAVENANIPSGGFVLYLCQIKYKKEIWISCHTHVTGSLGVDSTFICDDF